MSHSNSKILYLIWNRDNPGKTGNKKFSAITIILHCSGSYDQCNNTGNRSKSNNIGMTRTYLPSLTWLSTENSGESMEKISELLRVKWLNKSTTFLCIHNNQIKKKPKRKISIPKSNNKYIGSRKDLMSSSRTWVIKAIDLKNK